MVGSKETGFYSSPPSSEWGSQHNRSVFSILSLIFSIWSMLPSSKRTANQWEIMKPRTYLEVSNPNVINSTLSFMGFSRNAETRASSRHHSKKDAVSPRCKEE